MHISHTYYCVCMYVSVGKKIFIKETENESMP